MEFTNTTYLTNLRAIATIMVAVLHVCAIYMENFSVIELWQWQLVNIIDTATRICIGIFLMITGSLLLGQQIKPKEFLKKRILRILIPFIFWTALYSILQIIYFKVDVEKTIIKGVYFGAAYHFWYLYMLIGIYLLIPVISVFVLNASKKLIEYFLILWLISSLTNMIAFENVFPDYNLIYFSGYIGYVVLGYYLHFIIKKYPLNKLYIYYVLAYLFTFLITFFLSYNSNSLNTNYYQYLDLNVVVMAASLFLIFKRIGNFNSIILKQISIYSFGIYFIHPIFLKLIEIEKLTFSTIWAMDVILISIYVLLLSFISIYLLRKLPYAKNYIG